MIVWQGLGDEDVKRGARDPAALQAGDKSVLVDERAAGGIDNEQSGFGARQQVGIDQASRLGVSRKVERYQVGARHQLVECRIGDTEPLLRTMITRAPR